MILSTNYKISTCSMVNMYDGNPYTYTTSHPDINNTRDLLLYIFNHSHILKIDPKAFIQTIELDLYKLRKIYESNKSY
jgi:hypothetical protein